MRNTKIQNLVMLNGTPYNALTGKPIDKSESAATGHIHTAKHVPSPPLNSMQHAGKVMDGVASHSVVASPVSVAAASASNKNHHRKPAQHATRHTPQRSHTLMRATVKKPAGRLLDGFLDTVGPLPSPSSHYTAEEPLRHPLHAARIERSKNVGRSHLISKFNAATLAISKTTAHLPVRPAPDHAEPRVEPVRSRVAPTAQPNKPDPFSHAIEQATAHRQQPLHQSRRRLARKTGLNAKRLTVINGTLGLLLLAGFLAYRTIPDFTMRVAASRAGFQANMPDYKPSGFVLADRIQHQPGEVTVSYKSTSDGRAYKVTQRPSNWTSETLLDQVVMTHGQPYQTYQNNGRVIYIWDDNATWVNGGVWYQITGNSSLTTEQLLRIATSL